MARHWTVFNPLASGTPSSLDPETPNEEDAFIQQKLVYIACQLALLALAFYKVNSMGLLPNHSSDWLAFLPVKVVRSSHLCLDARADLERAADGNVKRISRVVIHSILAFIHPLYFVSVL